MGLNMDTVEGWNWCMDDCIAERLSLMGGIYRSTLLRGQVASLRDKASRDYTILIYHIWRYPNIL